MRRILDSGDVAAIQAMDQGIATADLLVKRGSFWAKTPSKVRVGNRISMRKAGSETQALKDDQNLKSSDSRRLLVRSGVQKGIEAMTGSELNRAPHLPVGSARK